MILLNIKHKNSLNKKNNYKYQNYSYLKKQLIVYIKFQ